MQVKMEVSGLNEMKLKAAGLGRKIPVITASALNDAAFAGFSATRKEIINVFDRPTPWVKGSVRYRKASKDKLYADIDFEAWGNKMGVTVDQVLKAEIFGGERKLKRHERALQRVGILPSGMAIVPGPAAQMDAYGNMAAAQIVQIVSWFQGFEQWDGARQNMTDKGKGRLGRDSKRTGKKGITYFVIYRPHGKLIPGIYQRITFGFGSAVKPVMYFVKIPRYSRRLDFYGIAERVANKEFQISVDRYVKQLLSERGL